MAQIALIGSGGHARECIDAARAAGDEVIGLIDEDQRKWGQSIMNVPIRHGGLSAIADLPNQIGLVIAIGDNRARARVADSLKGRWFAKVVHPFSWIAPSVAIGPGAMIFAGTVLQTEARVGAHAIINTGATLSHDCDVEDYSHVAVGCHLAGNVSIGEGAMLGAGVCARPGSHVGKWSIVGAGAVVIQDIADGTTAIGRGNAIPK